MGVTRRDNKPLLRWAGGKRWLLDHVERIVAGYEPSSYHEPFVGGAALFFGFSWPNAFLSDVNAELIATYRAIADSPGAIQRRLAKLEVSRDTYDKLRLARSTSDVERAVRLLYLNRCGYGGIYRTNRAGQFNVPFSGDRSTTTLWANGRLGELSTVLAGATLAVGDFEQALSSVGHGAVAYCDPAYALPTGDAPFRRYSPTAFSWNDQLRLARAAAACAQRGALVLVSNSSDPRVGALYKDGLGMRFERRVPLPNAAGRALNEALYVLGPAELLRTIEPRLAGSTW